jgi:hypothetical protein
MVSQLLLGLGWLTDWLIEEGKIGFILHAPMHQIYGTKKEELLTKN